MQEIEFFSCRIILGFFGFFISGNLGVGGGGFEELLSLVFL
jgi:hypothetical protein